MKKLLFISFLFCGTKLFAQTANAGADVTIYSTSTSTATLNGSASSGTSYLWTDISANIGYPMLMSKGIEGHPTNTGTITSSTSKTTTVTGLDQGTWYYQIAVTTGATTRYDTTIVNVDYTPPPSGGTLIKSLSPPIFSQIRSAVNTRYDTTNDIENEATTSLGEVFFQRGRLPGAYVDTLNGKFYAVIEDGYAWNGNGYDRSEVHFQGSTWNNGMGIDSNKTYVFEWRGYYPQNMDFLGVNLTVETLMQIHGDDGGDNPFGFYLINGTDGANELRGTPGVKGLYFEDQVVAATTLAGYYFIDNLSEFTNKAHTLRMIIREGKGYPGQDAFVKVEYDGVQMYYRDTGDVGHTWQRDYPKGAGIYDYNNAIVSPSNLSRGRKFGLVTEKYNIYEVSGGSISPPTCYAGDNQSLPGGTTTATLAGTETTASGHTATYLWTKESGPSCTITSPTSLTTGITGLSAGTYRFGLTVTQDDSQTAYDYTLVTIASGGITPLPVSNTLIQYGNIIYK